ncbi:MAG TPA: ATP-binding protein [Bryobacteraceae bacterium]|nr:ATP-binding protein [Bryobacteraceae bacterium]
MNPRSIGFRLAAWYFLVFAAGILAFSILSWFAMRASLYGAIDDTLRARADSLAVFLRVISQLPGEGMEEELQEHALPGPGGNLFQVRDESGKWRFRSPALQQGGIALDPPAAFSAPRFENAVADGRPVRLYSEKIQVGDAPYAIQVAAVTSEEMTALKSFRLMLLLAAPLLLIGATAGGYWLSRRALAPVDQMTTAAQRISAANLADRLRVPQTRDELQRLSQTLNEMLARLEGSVRRMSQFTADASHELRTPIALIRATAEIAVRRDRTAGEYRQALDDILHEAEQTSRVVDSLMLLARADSGTIQLEFARADLSDIVRGAAEAGETLARANGIALSTSLPALPLTVQADAHALRRVLLILMDNAAKYTPSGGWIKITADRRDGSAIVSVADNGIGIAPEDLPHIFDRFWRADKARSRDQRGAGLGLSIARWIAAGHGGAIDVESQPGKGSTFRLSLPIEPAGGA